MESLRQLPSIRMFSIHIQNLVFPGFILSQILMLKKNKSGKITLKLTILVIMNYFITCNKLLDRENSGYFFYMPLVSFT